MCEFKNGEEVKVLTREDLWDKATYIGHAPNSSFGVCLYRGEYRAFLNKHIKKLPKKVKMVKGLVDLMQALVDGGWKPDSSGNFQHSGAKDTFAAAMFFYCGKEPGGSWNWEPEWLEEKEL